MAIINPGRIPGQFSVSVGTSDTLALGEPGTNRRKDLVLTNSGTSNIWLGIGQQAEVGKGLVLLPGSQIIWSQTADYTVINHEIHAIAESGTQNLAVYVLAE